MHSPGSNSTLRVLMMKTSTTNDLTRTNSVPVKCVTCGAPAACSYYGAIACQACKIFFRRNARQGQETLKCDFGGNCEINIHNRRVCPFCRLMKCFRSGMKTEKIRSSQSKSKEIKKFFTRNLLRVDQSTLTVDQWNVLSNLSHCYNEHRALSISERFLSEQNLLPSTMQFRSTPMIEYMQQILNQSQSLYKTNRDLISLAMDDRSLLLYRTLKHVASLSSNFIIYKIGFMAHPAYFHTIGLISHSNMIPVCKLLATRLDFDMITMKLFLIILSFSTINYTIYPNTSPMNFSNIKEVLRIQNSYIELLWQYLLQKSNFRRTVICFSELIRCVFAVHEAIVQLQKIPWFTNTIASIAEQIELALILDE